MNAFLLIALFVVGYVIVCALWPYTSCGKCEGGGRFASPSGKHFRLCGRCGGSGRKVRAGRRVMAVLGIADDL